MGRRQERLRPGICTLSKSVSSTATQNTDKQGTACVLAQDGERRGPCTV